MYKGSRYVSGNGSGTLIYEIQDSCFGVISVGVTPKRIMPITVANLEACVIAAEYHRRGMNMPLNLAAYYLVRRGNERTYFADRITAAYRNMMDSRDVIHRSVPQLNYMNSYSKAVSNYILFGAKFIAPRLRDCY